MQTGSVVPTSKGGGFGVVLSARTLAADESGRELKQYRIRPISGIAGTNTTPVDNGRDPRGAEPRNAFSSTAGLQAPEGLDSSAGARPVAPETLTAAQTQASDTAAQDQRQGREKTGEEASAGAEAEAGGTTGPGKKLTPEERAIVARLQAIDAAVRQEEEAHAAAAGAFAGAPQYQYTIGPDGKRYATSGSVNVKVNVSGSPEQVERALKTIQTAALAPNNPSGADLSAFRSAVADQGAVRASRNANEVSRQLNAPRSGTGQLQDALRSRFAAAADAYRRTTDQ